MIPAPHSRPTCVVPANARAEVVLLSDDEELASWPLVCIGRPDLSLVDELARLQLAARRLGCSIWLRDACPELTGLLDLVGLTEVIGRPGGRRRSEVGGEAENGEQGGVEEVVVPDDPVA